MLNKRVVYALLLLLVVINLIIRYPFTPHLLGTDTFYIYIMGNELSLHGNGGWILSPLSFFGFYPYSYPIGYPIVLSSISQITGFSMEAIIYLSSLAITILTVLGMFILGRRYMINPLFGLIISFIYSTMPVVIAFSNWQATARGPILALLPITFYLIIMKTGIVKKILVLLLIVLALFALHREAVILLPLLFLPVIFKIYRSSRYLAIIRFIVGTHRILWTVSLMSLILISLLFSFTPFAPSIFKNSYWLTSEVSITLPSGLASLGVYEILMIYLAGRWGISLLFVFLGLIYAIFMKAKTELDWLIIFFLIIIGPFIAVVSYALEILSIVVAFFSGLFVLFLIKPQKRQITVKKLAAVLTVSAMISVSVFSVQYRIANVREDINYRNYLSDQEYETSLYVANSANGRHVSNEGLSFTRIVAIGQLPNDFDLIPQSAEVTFSFDDFISGFMENPISALKNPFIAPGKNKALNDIASLAYYPVDSQRAKDIMHSYAIHYATIKQLDGASYSKFYSTVMDQRYQVYASAEFKIYVL